MAVTLAKRPNRVFARETGLHRAAGAAIIRRASPIRDLNRRRSALQCEVAASVQRFCFLARFDA